MEQITKNYLLLINTLSKHIYSDNKLLSKASNSEKNQLDKIKKKLRDVSIYFSEKYKTSHGPSETSVVTGNDIAIGGKKKVYPYRKIKNKSIKNFKMLDVEDKLRYILETALKAAINKINQHTVCLGKA